MDREEFIKKMKELNPDWKPMEERSYEEQEEIYDSSFAWGDDDDDETEGSEKTVEKQFYYSEDEETEKEMIALFGIPDKEYDMAFEKCICTDNYEKLSTKELFEIVKPLENQEYWDCKLDGKNDREFLIGFIEWQKERAKDNGMLYDIYEKHGKHLKTTAMRNLRISETKQLLFGAIIGDIVGSRFEFYNHRSKDFEFFHKDCFATDDSIMTIAIANAVQGYMNEKGELGELATEWMQKLGRPYPSCGFGGRFFHWIYENNPKPYNSFGNGAAMRVSACGLFGGDLDEVKALSKAVTEVSHNHIEGLKGAEATAVCVFLARKRKSKQEIREYVNAHYYNLDFTLDEIRDSYAFNETCQETVPQAIEAFLESDSFEDAIRCGISIGGDSDTLCAITGAIAGAYYGIPQKFIEQASQYLDERLKKACALL